MAVIGAELERFHDMYLLDVVGLGEVSDGAGDLEDTVVSAS